MLRLNIKKKLGDVYLCLLHITAMYCPFGRVKRKSYRLRGTKIGRNVDFSVGVFMEESFPQHITIEDNVHIGPYTIIVAHDSSRKCTKQEPLIIKDVLIKNNSYIGAGAIILPGVTIGEYSVIGAGAVVTRDVPPYSTVKGVPGRIK